MTQVTGHRGRLTTLEQRADAMDKRIERLTEEMVKALTIRKGPEVIAWHDLDPRQYAAHLGDLAAWYGSLPRRLPQRRRVGAAVLERP